MTVSAPPATLETWLSYARLGIPIVPEHTPDPTSATGCDCRKDDCTKPGKHPRTLNGSTDATTDEATIRRWHQMFPHANVGTSLEMAGLVIIGPDSPEWAAEFERRGLKDGPVARSGGGEGHLHHFRRLPPGVPATRICQSGAYDILAKGNAILSPSLHASGRQYEWIVPITSLDDVPYLEEWACAELRATGARQRAEIHRGGDDEPPVVLDDYGLRVWRGELPKLHKDGTVERSGTLLKIGRVLYDAGATRRTIVAELAEIDAARYQKYTPRKDAGEQYHAIVDELERHGRTPRPADDTAPTRAGGDGAEGCIRCSQKDVRIRELEERGAEVEKRLHDWKAILSNPKLKPADRIVAIPILEAIEYGRRAGQDETHVRFPGIVNGWGLPESTVQKSAAVLTDMPGAPLKKRHGNKRVTIKDPKTGEPIVVTSKQAIYRPLVDGDLFKVVARYDPGLPTRGGARHPLEHCPEHPDADLKVRHTKHCSVCRRPVGEPTETTLRLQNDAIGETPPSVDTGILRLQNDAIEAERAAAMVATDTGRAVDTWKRLQTKLPIDFEAIREARQQATEPPNWLAEWPDRDPEASPPADRCVFCPEPLAPGSRVACTDHQRAMGDELPIAVAGGSDE